MTPNKDNKSGEPKEELGQGNFRPGTADKKKATPEKGKDTLLHNESLDQYGFDADQHIAGKKGKKDADGAQGGLI